MKRIYIAIAFAAICLGIAAAEIGYVSGKVDTFSAQIEKADKLMYRADYAEAIEVCNALESEWEQSAKIIDMVLIHDYVDSIGINISQMKTFAENQNRDMYFSLSTAAKKELASIKESEYPLWENIL